MEFSGNTGEVLSVRGSVIACSKPGVLGKVCADTPLNKLPACSADRRSVSQDFVATPCHETRESSPRPVALRSILIASSFPGGLSFQAFRLML
jgi:hypothetical protein